MLYFLQQKGVVMIALIPLPKDAIAVRVNLDSNSQALITFLRKRRNRTA